MSLLHSLQTREVTPDASSVGVIGAIRPTDRFRFQGRASAHAAARFQKWAQKNMLPISSAWEADGSDSPNDVGHGYVVELSENDKIEAAKEARQIADRHKTYYRIEKLAPYSYLVYFTSNPSGLAAATATVDGVILHPAAIGSLAERWQSATQGEGKIRRLKNRIQRTEEKLAKLRSELEQLDPSYRADAASEEEPEDEAAGLVFIGSLAGWLAGSAAPRGGRGQMRRMSGGGMRRMGGGMAGRRAFGGRFAPRAPSSYGQKPGGYGQKPSGYGQPQGQLPYGQDGAYSGGDGFAYGGGGYGYGTSPMGDGGYGGGGFQPQYDYTPAPVGPQVLVLDGGESEDDIAEKERYLGFLEEEERRANEQPQVIYVNGVSPGYSARQNAIIGSLGGAHDSDFLPDDFYGDVWTDVQYPGFGG
jgi:hypothetical protein